MRPVPSSKAKAEQDLTGLIVMPGFIDGHVHVESSHMLPHHYAEVVVPQGTTTIFWDPHELANVLGLDGIRYAVASTRNLPLALHRAGFVLRAGGAGAGDFRRRFQGRRNPRIDVVAGCRGTCRSHGYARGAGDAAAHDGHSRSRAIASGKIIEGHARGLTRPGSDGLSFRRHFRRSRNRLGRGCAGEVARRLHRRDPRLARLCASGSGAGAQDAAGDSDEPHGLHRRRVPGLPRRAMAASTMCFAG